MRGETGGAIMSWRTLIQAVSLAAILATVGCGGGPPDPAWPGDPESPRAEVVVDFSRAHEGRVPVSMRVIGLDVEPYQFVFKADPDEYRIHDVRFTDDEGRPIEHRQKGNVYTLDPIEGDVVRAEWETEPGGIGRHGLQGVIRDDFATFDGRLFLMPRKAFKLRAARIHFAVPRGWNVATPFRSRGGWHYLDSFEPEDTSRLLEESCVGVGRFDVERRRFGEMEVRVASYSGWSKEYRAEVTDSGFRILEFFHDTFDFDLRSPYLVLWTPRVRDYRVHGGSSVNGTCLDHPGGKLRPYQLLSHRVAHCIDKYRPAGMQVVDPTNRWFREGFPSYMEVIATEATGIAEGRTYFNTLYSTYKATRKNHPEHDLPLARESEAHGEAEEYLHYRKAPLVTKMLADWMRDRTEHTLEEFVREMWARHGWYRDGFDMRNELEAYTGVSFGDFWEMTVDSRGEVIPAWDDYVTDRMRLGLRKEPAARAGGDPLSGPYLHYLASSGEFATFEEIHDFLVAAGTRHRELEARGVRLYRENLRKYLYALPPQERLAIARFELSYPLEGAPVSTKEVRLEIDRDHYDGAVFAELLELERDYFAAVARSAMTKLELRAADGPATGKSRLAFGVDSTLLVAPEWRTPPTRVDVEMVCGEKTWGNWSFDRFDPIRITPGDRPTRSGVVILRVAPDGRTPISRAFWQRGFERNRGRAHATRDMGVHDTENPGDWFRNGVVLAASRDYAAALESFKKAVSMDPDDARKWNKVGEMLAHLEQHDEALKSFDHAVALRPRFLTAAGNRALSLAALGRREDSVAALANLLDADPVSSSRFLWKGRILEELEDRDEAVAAYREYAELEPRRPEAWYRLGHVLLTLQRNGQAVAAFDEALALDPRHVRSIQERNVALRVIERENR
jgi:Flp pilus assembly protein TadD